MQAAQLHYSHIIINTMQQGQCQCFCIIPVPDIDGDIDI
jgi:hypothetical protein